MRGVGQILGKNTGGRGKFKMKYRLSRTVCMGKRDSSVENLGGGGSVGQKNMTNVILSLINYCLHNVSQNTFIGYIRSIDAMNVSIPERVF